MSQLKAKNYTLHNGPLTDDAIFAYCLAGVYGEDRRSWAEAELRRVKRIKQRKTKTKTKRQQLIDAL